MAGALKKRLQELPRLLWPVSTLNWCLLCPQNRALATPAGTGSQAPSLRNGGKRISALSQLPRLRGAVTAAGMDSSPTFTFQRNLFVL